jgi:hypothetical protein
VGLEANHFGCCKELLTLQRLRAFKSGSYAPGVGANQPITTGGHARLCKGCMSCVMCLAWT